MAATFRDNAGSALGAAVSLPAVIVENFVEEDCRDALYASVFSDLHLVHQLDCHGKLNKTR